LAAHPYRHFHMSNILGRRRIRVHVYDPGASKRPVNVMLNSDLVARARAEGLNLSALAEEAVAAALIRIAQKKVEADIAQACRVYEHYLAEYGSLGSAVRAMGDAAEQTVLAGHRSSPRARLPYTLPACCPTPRDPAYNALSGARIAVITGRHGYFGPALSN
jgi:antitoxin CcdA